MNIINYTQAVWGEAPVCVIKCKFCYSKVRYKRIAINAAQVFSLIGLTNIYLARRTLIC